MQVLLAEQATLRQRFVGWRPAGLASLEVKTMENGHSLGIKVSPNYVRKAGANVHCAKPAPEPIEAAGQGEPKVGARGPVADDPPWLLRAPVSAAPLDGWFRELLERHPDWPCSVIWQKAESLGLFRKRKGGYRRWSEEADQMLIACERLEMNVIKKWMKRSMASIRSRLAALDRVVDFPGGFKTKDLMEMLHLDESAIRRLERRHLVLRERGRITEDSLRSLCREHPEEIPFETLDDDRKRMLVADYDYGKPKRSSRIGTAKE